MLKIMHHIYKNANDALNAELKSTAKKLFSKWKNGLKSTESNHDKHAHPPKVQKKGIPYFQFTT